jgi:acyl-CoA dehydrogenase
MKVTTEGERVVGLLADVIAARGFEKDTYFEMAVRDVRALPKLEGTVHVNMALVLKFLAGYFFATEDLPSVPTRRDAADDEFLFRQGPTRGLGAVRFGDWRAPYASWRHVDNVAVFVEQAEALRTLLMTAPPDEAQRQDLDFLLTLGELFSLVAYGQLVLEQATITDAGDDLVGQVFDTFVRDFSDYAVQLHGRSSSTPEQQAWARSVIRKPVADPARLDRMVARVRALAGSYEMRP